MESNEYINKDGKAFNGNYGAVAVAIAFASAVVIGLIVAAVSSVL